MRRRNENVTEFKNGNLNIRFTPENIKDAEKDEILILTSVLADSDCSFIGETYCLNNFETGHTLYNAYSDLVYVFPWRYLADLRAGKTVKLYARKPDDTDKELIESEQWQ